MKVAGSRTHHLRAHLADGLCSALSTHGAASGTLRGVLILRAADAGCSTNRRTRTRARWTAFKGPWHTPFGWNTFVVKRTFGGLSGYWSQKVMRKLNIPPSHGVSAGPKIVAAHTKIFSSLSGAALAPCQRTPRASARGSSSAGCGRKPQLQGGEQLGGRRAGRAQAGCAGSTHLRSVLLHLAQVAHEAERGRILVRHRTAA